MKIEEVSAKFSIPKATLRYWESAGLLPKIKRDASGYRDYSHQNLNWVMYVMVLRKAGMSIGKLKKFIDLYREPQTKKERKQILIQQQHELEAQRNEITKTLNYLNYKINNFDSHMLGYEKEFLAYDPENKK